MDLAIELRIVLMSLVIYILGVIGPNHHPKKSFKALGSGVVNVTIVIGIAILFPIFIKSLANFGSNTLRVILVFFTILMSASIILIRYYGTEERIRNFNL